MNMRTTEEFFLSQLKRGRSVILYDNCGQIFILTFVCFCPGRPAAIFNLSYPERCSPQKVFISTSSFPFIASGEKVIYLWSENPERIIPISAISEIKIQEDSHGGN